MSYISEIKYPKRETEAEIQSILWQELKGRGLDARLQVWGVLGGRKRKSRFDIVVFRDRVPQAIIECKSWSKYYNAKKQEQLENNTKQLRRYQSFGLPVFVCGRLDMIGIIADEVSSLPTKVSEAVKNR